MITIFYIDSDACIQLIRVRDRIASRVESYLFHSWRRGIRLFVKSFSLCTSLMVYAILPKLTHDLPTVLHTFLSREFADCSGWEYAISISHCIDYSKESWRTLTEKITSASEMKFKQLHQAFQELQILVRIIKRDFPCGGLKSYSVVEC